MHLVIIPGCKLCKDNKNCILRFQLIAIYMSELTKPTLITYFTELGNRLLQPDDQLQEIISCEQNYNAWFTPANVLHAVQSIGKMLNQPDLERWLPDDINTVFTGKKIGLVLAGNIPLVGFHDVLCVLVSGHFAQIKASANDARLITHLLKVLVEIAPQFANRFEFTERLQNFNAVMATGSNNTSRYFEYYFGKVPNIIRKNRNSVAVLTGAETTEQLAQLGHDIFDYFGLGCRNVSKIMVPRDYDFNRLFKAIEVFQPIINHHKYNNNYDYNKSILLVNGVKHLDNGFLLLKEDQQLASPLAVLNYSIYETFGDAETELKKQESNIQCLVAEADIVWDGQLVGFGQSQSPKLWDYADGVNTLAFLQKV